MSKGMSHLPTSTRSTTLASARPFTTAFMVWRKTFLMSAVYPAQSRALAAK